MKRRTKKEDRIIIIVVSGFIILLMTTLIILNNYHFGTITFWINNYEGDCEAGNCYNLAYDFAYIDGISDSSLIGTDLNISSKDYWETTQRLTSGIHNILLIGDEGRNDLEIKIDITSGEHTCFEMAFFMTMEYDPGYYHSNRCPP